MWNFGASRRNYARSRQFFCRIKPPVLSDSSSRRLRFAQTTAYMSRSVSRVLLSYGHLSRRTVAGTLQPPREQPGQPIAPIPVLLRIEFTAADAFTRRRVSSYLAFPPPYRLHHNRRSRRYISVALFLKSPSAGVTRYPCPAEPGLSSWTGFRLYPRDRLICSYDIIKEWSRKVNCAFLRKKGIELHYKMGYNK